MTSSPPGLRKQSRKKPLSNRAKQFWLTLHYFAMLGWIAGAIGCVVLVLVTRGAADPAILKAAHAFVVVLDNWLIIPGAMACLISGVWLAWRTNWGLTRYWWILVKLLGNIGLMLLGIFYMHGLIEKTFRLSRQSSLPNWGALLTERQHLLAAQGFSLLLLLTIVVISVYKPWGKIKRD